MAGIFVNDIAQRLQTMDGLCSSLMLDNDSAT
jgi:hypothetical protein